MKKIAIIVIVIALIGIGVWVLLSVEKGVEEGVVSPGEEAITPGTELSLTEIFGKAKGISSFKYDMVATAPGETAVTTKMWREGGKMRMEGAFEGKSMVYLVDADKQLAYMYFPAENTAMEIDLSNAQETAGESPSEQSESVIKYNPVTLGTETLDGKSCSVIEYSAETEKVKMWVWIEYGLPIRTETTTEKGTSVVELRNIDFGSISDSMFELPAGVQIMEVPFGL